MNVSPTSNPFGPRLDKLNREINAGLSEVRRHLKGLEAVEKQASQSTESASFADLLKKSIDEAGKRKN